jgi:hypothetical protein
MACHGKSRDFPPFPRKNPDKLGVTFEQTILYEYSIFVIYRDLY